MTRRAPAKPAAKLPAGLRQRLRADGTVRLWWEPRADQKAKGFAVVELGQNLTEAVRQARKLNEAWAETLRTGKMPPRRGGARHVSALIADYKASVHWKTRIKPKTRDSYARVFALIEDKWGADPVADFDVPTMHTWYQSLYREKSPRMAQAMLAHMSILMKHARLIGWRLDNPCLGLQLATPAPRDRVVTWAEFDALVAAAETAGWPHMALALRLGWFQGQRQTDIRTARRGDFALIPITAADGTEKPGWVWSFRQSKRGQAVQMQMHPDVIPALRLALADTGSASAPRQTGDALLIDPATGKPLSEDLFAKRFAAIRHAAAATRRSCATLQFRDLRRSFAVMARAAGVDDADTADALGNTAATNAHLRQAYMPSSLTTTSRAVAAIQRPGGPKKKGTKG